MESNKNSKLEKRLMDYCKVASINIVDGMLNGNKTGKFTGFVKLSGWNGNLD